MKRSIFKGMMCLLLLGVGATSVYAQQQQRKDTLVVARDGTGEYRNIQEAVEAVRAFMDYTVTIFIKNGIYRCCNSRDKICKSLSQMNPKWMKCSKIYVS